MNALRSRALHRVVLGLLAAVGGACERTPIGTQPPHVVTVVVDPASDTLFPGVARTLRARVLDERGAAMSDVSLTWTSSDTAIVSVDSMGSATGRRPGEARVRAATGQVWAEARLSVAAPTCTRQGTSHSGSVANESWKAADSPHHVQRVVISGTLVLEAGVLVCAAGADTISLSASGTKLVAHGSAGAPVVFTAADPSAPWGGIWDGGHGAQAELTHVLIENATNGVYVGGLELDSSRIRQIHPAQPGRLGGTAITLIWGHLRHLTIDSADSGVWPGNWNSDITLEDAVLRGSGEANGTGVYCRRWGKLALRRTHIEGFATGIRFEEYTGDCTLTDAAGVRLVRNAQLGYLPVNAASALLALTGPENLRGNDSDTLHIFGTASADLAIPAGIPVAAWNLALSGPSTLRLQAGADFILNLTGNFSPFSLQPGQRLVALGTAAAPVRLTELGKQPVELGGVPGAPSQLVHANVRGLQIVASSGRQILVDSSHFSGGATLQLGSAGSRVTATQMEDARDSAAILVHADSVAIRQITVTGAASSGVHIAGGRGVLLDSCAVSGAAGDAVRVSGGSGVRVSHCNLAGNAGAGLANTSEDTVDARLNWWGDAAGPGAPGAARVLGPANYVPWATAPIPIRAAAFAAALPEGRRRAARQSRE